MARSALDRSEPEYVISDTKIVAAVNDLVER